MFSAPRPLGQPIAATVFLLLTTLVIPSVGIADDGAASDDREDDTAAPALLECNGRDGRDVFGGGDGDTENGQDGGDCVSDAAGQS